MSEHADCLAYDEEADAEPVAPLMVKTGEGVEDFLHFLFRDAAALIEDVDADVATHMAAAHEDATAGLGIFDGVADQVTEHGAEKQGIAHDRCTGRNGPDLDSLSQG